LWLGAPINFWAIGPDAQVAVTSGGSELTEFNPAGARGPTSCKRCGSALFNRKPKIGMTVVYAMTLAESGFAYAPTFHCYYGEGVVHLADGLPKFEDLPKPLGGSGQQFDEPARTELRR
jgi:hypothetical protein